MPTEFTWDYSTGVFQFSWDADPGAGETEIILPAWVAEVGFEATLDGTPFIPVRNAHGNRLIISPGRAGPVTLEMRVNGAYPG